MSAPQTPDLQPNPNPRQRLSSPTRALAREVWNPRPEPLCPARCHWCPYPRRVWSGLAINPSQSDVCGPHCCRRRTFPRPPDLGSTRTPPQQRGGCCSLPPQNEDCTVCGLQHGQQYPRSTLPYWPVLGRKTGTISRRPSPPWSSTCSLRAT